MGWLSEDYEHEGWTACEMPDGRLTCGTTRGGPDGGVAIMLSDDQGFEYVDGREAVGWRARCDCREGWVGPLWRRVTDPDQADVAGRLVYAEPDVYGDPPADVEELILADWQAHTRRPDADEATPGDHREVPTVADTDVEAVDLPSQFGAGVVVACTCGRGDDDPLGHDAGCGGSVELTTTLQLAGSRGVYSGALTRRESDLLYAVADLIRHRRGERGGPDKDIDLGQLARRLIRTAADEICGGGEQL